MMFDDILVRDPPLPSYMAELNEEDEETIDAKVLKVSALLIVHSYYAQRKSALVHFFEVLGYDARKKWREPNLYTPILAGVQFCMGICIAVWEQE